MSLDRCYLHGLQACESISYVRHLILFRVIWSWILQIWQYLYDVVCTFVRRISSRFMLFSLADISTSCEIYFCERQMMLIWFMWPWTLQILQYFFVTGCKFVQRTTSVFKYSLRILGRCYLHGLQACETYLLSASNDAGQSYVPFNFANIAVFLCNWV